MSDQGDGDIGRHTDRALAKVERLHFDLDREARARQEAEGAVERVRAWAREYISQWHPDWQPEAFTFDMGVGAAAHDVLAALDPAVPATEGGEADGGL
jgi:hypothetical protein